MIQASPVAESVYAIHPFMVVLRSSRLSVQSLPDALSFQTAEVSDWGGVFHKLSTFRPGCVLVDFDEGREHVLSAVREFADQGIRFSIIGVTVDRSRRTLHQAMRHGILDLVSRPLDARALGDAVNEAFHYDSHGDDSLCEMRSCFAKLTPKEREMLPHLLLGVPSRRLASQFLVTYQTIDRHRKRVVEKMKVDNMTELAMKLYRHY